ncbi:MAG: fructosamine kinase family protein [Pricia sp.]
MENHLKEHIEYLLCVNIDSVRSVSGGDISRAYLLKTETERFFCKVNYGENALGMFNAEKAGLEAIAETMTIAVPTVLLCEGLEKGGLLLMEYIEPKNGSSEEMAHFGNQLATLHRNTALHSESETASFGWEADNFIGSLPQLNRKNTDWSKFYVSERLLPQLKLARQHNRLQTNEIPSEERLLKTCRNFFPKVTPSLLHGDLWSGNYLISSSGTPYLIDPATYFGHHEVDIAMTRLFGGFGKDFYNAYTEHFPKIGGEPERNDIYQLYYLLVHLNLFGGSYRASVTNILNRYF